MKGSEENAMIFDTHTHYDDEAYDTDREKVIASLVSGGVGRICNIGSTFRGACVSLTLAERYEHVYAAVGVHPDDVADLENDSDPGNTSVIKNESAPAPNENSGADSCRFLQLREMAKHPRAVAIGEIGLDYHGFDRWPDKPSKEKQIYWFQKQLDLAIELDMPVVIHSRNAASDTLEMLQDAHRRGLKNAVLHCFSYSKELALEYVSMGYYIGFGGVLTYHGQKKLTAALEAIPRDRILLETDCPYLTPVPYRNQKAVGAPESAGESAFVRNCSLYLDVVRDRIAQVLGMTGQEVEQLTWDNANRFFRLT